MKKTVKFLKIHKDATIPTYAHEKDSGMDLYSVQSDIIPPMTYKAIPTGICVELPEGTEAQVRSKSGVAFNNGVFVLNSPGTVDECYRGEIMAILYNLGKKDFVIEPKQKIAQLVIADVCYCNTEEVKEISSSDRGNGKFGSTGIK